MPVRVALLAGIPLTYTGTYQNALTTTIPACFTQSNVSSVCCSQSASDVLYQFSLTPPSYWAFSIAPASHSMSLTFSARHRSSLIGVVDLYPFSGSTQSSLGVKGRATLLNLPNIYGSSNLSDQLLFIDSNNPLDQGVTSWVTHME